VDTYSEDYYRIRVHAVEWPDWKSEAYNRDFSTSKNAKKLDTDTTSACNFLYCEYNLNGQCSAPSDQRTDCKYRNYDNAKHDRRLLMLNHKATGNEAEIVESVRRIINSLNYMSEK